MNTAEIIVSNNKIYHLGLAPEQLCDTIITVGDPERVPLVSRFFDKIHSKTVRREFVTHIGELQGKQLMVLSTGIGTDNIDIVFNELHILANYDLKTLQAKTHFKKLRCIRVGTSGALMANIPVDTFLVSEDAYGLDNLMHFYEYSASENGVLLEMLKQQLPVVPYYATASKELLEVFAEIPKGTTLTCPGFYGPQGRMLPHTKFNLLEKLHGIPLSNMEMETAGIYGMCNMLGHEAISLNAILANRSTGAFSQHPAKTVEKLIELALESLVKL